MMKVDEMSIIKYHGVMNIGYEISITNYRNDIMSGSELSMYVLTAEKTIKSNVFKTLFKHLKSWLLVENPQFK